MDQEAEEYSQIKLHEKNEGPADEILLEEHSKEQVNTQSCLSY